MEEIINRASLSTSAPRPSAGRGERPFGVSQLAVLAACALLLAASTGQALASTYGDPLSTGNLPSSSAVLNSFARDATHGNYTGADGTTDSAIWAVSTDLGYIVRYNGDNTTPVDFTPTGLNLTGLAKMGGENYMLTAGLNLYKGYTDGTGWHTTQTISLTAVGIPSNATDVAVNLNHIFVTTQSSGVYRLDMNGQNATQIDAGLFQSVDVLTFVPGAFDNAVIQYDGDQFVPISEQGEPFGVLRTVHLGNASTPRGIAYYRGSDGNHFAVVGKSYVDLHAADSLGNVLPNVQLEATPEPSTSALMALGLAALALRRRKR